MKKYFLLLFAIVTTLACSKKINPTVGSLPDTRPINDKKSYINLSMQYDFSTDLSSVENVLPKHKSSNQQCEDPNNTDTRCAYDKYPYLDLNTLQPNQDCHDIQFTYDVIRSPLEFSVNNNTIRLSTLMTYTIFARKYVSLLIGHICPNADCFDAQTRLNLDLHPLINPNYSISLTPISSYEIVRPCNLSTFLGINIGDFSGKIAEVLKKQVDLASSNAVSSISNSFNLKNVMASAWSQSFNPIKVSDNFWLTLNPRNVTYTGFNFSSGKQVSTTVRLELSPTITYSSNAPSVTATSLPDLGNENLGNDFRVWTPINVDYKEVQNQMDKYFEAKDGGIVYLIPGTNKKIYLTKAKIYAYGRQVQVQVYVKGFLKGWLIAQGEPTYDQPSHTIYLNNVNFSTETENLLTKVLAKLYQNQIIDLIKQNTKIQVGTYLNKTTEQIQQALNKQYGQMKLTGTVNNADVLGIFSSTQGINPKLTIYTDLSGNVSGQFIK